MPRERENVGLKGIERFLQWSLLQQSLGMADRLKPEAPSCTFVQFVDLWRLGC